jgi:ABC-type transporter Mla MlaB component
MSITIIHQSQRTWTAVLRLAGVLDRSNYHDLLAQALVACDVGARHLIVDLSDVERVSTAGMVGLHAVAMLARGAPPPDPESGWAAIRAIAECHPHLRRLAVVNPRPSVREALAGPPYTDFLTIHADLDTALAALAA